MKTTTTFYRWMVTVLFSLLMLSSGVQGLMATPAAVKSFQALGYPMYFIGLLSIAKILGVIVILMPVNFRVKEWAFAGFAVDLVAATYSLYCARNNHPEGPWYGMVLPIALFVATYLLQRSESGTAGRKRKIVLSRAFRPEHVAIL
jgi:hypothetical protein